MFVNKKGAIDIFIGSLIVILVIAGTIIVNQEYDTKYIGNKENKNLYELKNCPYIYENIKKENIEVFSSLEDAKSKNYNLIEECG